MSRTFSVLCGALALLATVGAHAASHESTGIAPSGATYHIEVPDSWHAGDTLVLYQHGFDLEPAVDPPGLGPLRGLMVAEGYAVAATSYRQAGWALFTAIEDNQELLDLFTAAEGAPGEVIPFGGSMGGLIALKLAEAPGFPPVHAAYALCPAAAGARLWDAAIDLRLAYDVVCHDAGELPHGDPPLPWAFNLDMIPSDLGDLFDQAQIARALLPLNQCTGVNLPASLRNGAMQRRLDELMAFTHITDEDFFVTNVGYATFVLSELVRAPDKLDSHNAFTTAGVDYASDPVIQAGIARIVAEPAAAQRLHDVSDFHGDVGDAKVISMHTSRDQLVIPGNQDFVRNVLPATQLTSAIVDETDPTHCGFTDAEGVAGWEALRGWEAGAAQPEVADLQAQCEAIVATGTVAGPCRFDPDALIVPFDSIVRPRPDGTSIPVGHSTHAIPAGLLGTHERARGPAQP